MAEKTFGGYIETLSEHEQAALRSKLAPMCTYPGGFSAWESGTTEPQFQAFRQEGIEIPDSEGGCDGFWFCLWAYRTAQWMGWA